MLEKIKNSYIYYSNEWSIHTMEYYKYCTNLFKEYLKNSDIEINIIFGDYNFDFKNDNRTIRAQIQFEHTLVKEGGRGLNGSEPIGKIPEGNNFYRVRVSDFEKLNEFDMIVEYSIPNIKNVSSCEELEEFSKKLTYIAALLYDYEQPKMEGRDIKCVTMFYNIHEPRRKVLLDAIATQRVNSFNVTNCFSGKDIKELYSKTKMLLNIRQTDHHHTFEELRVLPALLNGVIVISEDVPLRESIPYNEFIIWCKYKDILNVQRDVETNYKQYWEKIFGGDRLKNTIEKMSSDNKQNIERFFEK